MSVTYHPPEWKTIRSHPRYEVSAEGRVRVKKGFQNAGKLLTLFWNDGHTHTTANGDPFDVAAKGSLCVELHDFPKHTTRRVWKLMERYWPEVEYPEGWRKQRPKAKPVKEDKEPDRRFKLTESQINAIVKSRLSSSELAKMYPVSARHIRSMKQKADTNA